MHMFVFTAIFLCNNSSLTLFHLWYVALRALKEVSCVFLKLISNYACCYNKWKAQNTCQEQ